MLLRYNSTCTSSLFSFTVNADWLNLMVVTKEDIVKYYVSIYHKIALPVSSAMFPMALVIAPGITQPLNDEGIVKLRSNVSGPSAILSLINGTLTVALVDIAEMVAMREVEL